MSDIHVLKDFRKCQNLKWTSYYSCPLDFNNDNFNESNDSNKYFRIFP